MSNKRKPRQNDKVESNEVNEFSIADENDDGEYLSFNMIDTGIARNIVTVKITTQKGKFLVDVLKKNALYRMVNEENKERELLTEEEIKELPADERSEYINNQSKEVIAQNSEYLFDYIVQPQLELDDDGKLLIEGNPIPGDVIDLLLKAYDFVNKEKQTAEAVAEFQGNN